MTFETNNPFEVITGGAKILAATLALSALLAAVPARAADDGGVVGRWFTEGVERNIHLQVFLDNKMDGTYEKDVRAVSEECRMGRVSKEIGKWQFEQGSLGTTSETVDGKPVTGSPADIHDVFTVTRVDDTHINLFDIETRITWSLTLASPTAAFPTPRGCSI
jgi:hypothetical protein